MRIKQFPATNNTEEAINDAREDAIEFSDELSKEGYKEISFYINPSTNVFTVSGSNPWHDH